MSDAELRRCALAPMSPLIRGLTVILFLLPCALVAGAVGTGQLGLFPIAAALVLLYALVWLALRPRAFVVRSDRLEIRFPLYVRTIARDEIRSASVVEYAQLRAELGVPVRIGAGGLWGTFGWVWTTGRGLIDVYASSHHGLVWIERHSARPIVITPENPDRFVGWLAR